VFFITGFFRTQPAALAERHYWTVLALGHVLPGDAAAGPTGSDQLGIFKNFLGMWNQYLLPLVLYHNPTDSCWRRVWPTWRSTGDIAATSAVCFAALDISMVPVLVCIDIPAADHERDDGRCPSVVVALPRGRVDHAESMDNTPSRVCVCA